MVTFSAITEPVAPPSAIPYRYGLFSVVQPRGDLPHFPVGVSWASNGCGQARITTGPCLDPEADTTLHPETSCDVMEYEPFTVYVMSDDSAFRTRTPADWRAVATDRMAAAEQEAVEAALWALMVAAVTELDVSAKALGYVIGWVEQRLAELYGNVGVIHMNRLAATVAIGLGYLRVSGQRIETALGTLVVAGGGYEQIGDTIPDDATIYGTGPLVMYRNALDLNDSFNRDINNVQVVAQRDYVLGWDCVAIGATATIG